MNLAMIPGINSEEEYDDSYELSLYYDPSLPTCNCREAQIISTEEAFRTHQRRTDLESLRNTTKSDWKFIIFSAFMVLFTLGSFYATFEFAKFYNNSFKTETTEES